MARFPFPLLPAEFEIPDEWLGEAGMKGFTPLGRGYRSAAAAVLVPLREIEPPFRSREHPKDWRGFDRARLIDVLRGIVAAAEIPPVPLFALPPLEFWQPSPFRYRVKNGVHRFYGSVAAGFECLPAEIS